MANWPIVPGDFVDYWYIVLGVLHIRPELKSLARQLRNARTKAGLTQGEVAEKLEVTAQTIRNWEVRRTEPSATPKEALSRIYGIRTAELVDLNDRKGLSAIAPFT